MRSKIIGLVAAAALLVPVAGAGADPGSSTHVDSVSAAVTGSVVSVAGSASFVDIPRLVGEDPQGDALVAGIGTDITDIKVSRTAPNGRINFTLGIADQPPTLNGMPETIAYYWDINVRNPDGSESGYELWAARSAQNAAIGGTVPVFRRYVCVDNPTTGARDCGTAINVPGRMQDGVVEWQVSPSQINADTGAVITGVAIEVSPTVSGLVWGVLRLDGNGAFQDQDYTVPGAQVQVGIAPAGTDPASVPLTASASVNATNGSFTGALPKPAEAGSYVVVAKACWSSDSCGLASTTVTV